MDNQRGVTAKRRRTDLMDWSPENCSIARTLGILGEKWTLVVLRDVFGGIRRFNDLVEHSGVPRQVLTNRLSVLVDEGILRRDTYQEPGSRPRPEYRLTEKGLDTYRILIALREWGRPLCGRPGGTAPGARPPRLRRPGHPDRAVRRRP
ncbi:hypothetical protein GCM10020256_31600 [Streptomyces thermocoprophilus]